jgi:hypothetical protein
MTTKPILQRIFNIEEEEKYNHKNMGKNKSHWIRREQVRRKEN